MEDQGKSQVKWIYNRGELTLVIEEWTTKVQGKRKAPGWGGKRPQALSNMQGID